MVTSRKNTSHKNAQDEQFSSETQSIASESDNWASSLVKVSLILVAGLLLYIGYFVLTAGLIGEKDSQSNSTSSLLDFLPEPNKDPRKGSVYFDTVNGFAIYKECSGTTLVYTSTQYPYGGGVIELEQMSPECEGTPSY